MAPQHVRQRSSARRPITQNGLDQSERGDGSRIGPQDAWTERQPHDPWQTQEPVALFRRKTAFRADDHGEGPRPARRKASSGSAISRFLVAENHEPFGGPRVHQPLELHFSTNLGDGENAALLGRLDRICPHPFDIDAGHLRVLRVTTGRIVLAPISTAFWTM